MLSSDRRAKSLLCFLLSSEVLAIEIQMIVKENNIHEKVVHGFAKIGGTFFTMCPIVVLSIFFLDTLYSNDVC